MKQADDPFHLFGRVELCIALEISQQRVQNILVGEFLSIVEERNVGIKKMFNAGDEEDARTLSNSAK